MLYEFLLPLSSKHEARLSDVIFRVLVWCFSSGCILKSLQYATALSNPTVKNVRLGFTELKNLQVRICAELEEEIRIRNWKV